MLLLGLRVGSFQSPPDPRPFPASPAAAAGLSFTRPHLWGWNWGGELGGRFLLDRGAATAQQLPAGSPPRAPVDGPGSRASLGPAGLAPAAPSLGGARAWKEAPSFASFPLLSVGLRVPAPRARPAGVVTTPGPPRGGLGDSESSAGGSSAWACGWHHRPAPHTGLGGQPALPAPAGRRSGLTVTFPLGKGSPRRPPVCVPRREWTFRFDPFQTCEFQARLAFGNSVLRRAPPAPSARHGHVGSFGIGDFAL